MATSNASCACPRPPRLHSSPGLLPQTYLSCMQQKKSTHYRCSDASRDYLECRMSRGLMTEEDLDSLGYAADRRVHSKDIPQTKKEDAEREQAEGGQALGCGSRLPEGQPALLPVATATLLPRERPHHQPQ